MVKCPIFNFPVVISIASRGL